MEPYNADDEISTDEFNEAPNCYEVEAAVGDRLAKIWLGARNENRPRKCRDFSLAGIEALESQGTKAATLFLGQIRK